MALDSWQYRDPLEVAIRKESQTCKGCNYEEVVIMFGGEVKVCNKSRKHGKRCKHYLPRQ